LTLCAACGRKESKRIVRPNEALHAASGCVCKEEALDSPIDDYILTGIGALNDFNANLAFCQGNGFLSEGTVKELLDLDMRAVSAGDNCECEGIEAELLPALYFVKASVMETVVAALIECRANLESTLSASNQ